MGLADLHGGVDELLGLDLGLLDDESLHETVIAVGRELDRLGLAFAAHLREWEQRGVYERDGSRSPAHRLARELRSSVGARRLDMRRARRVDDLPLTTRAVLDGRLSLDHFDLLASVNTVERRHLFARDESVLVQQCESLPYFLGRKVVRHWANRADEELEAERAAAFDGCVPEGESPAREPHDLPGDESTVGSESTATGTGVDDEPLPTDERSRLYANRTLDDVLDVQGTFGPIDGTIIELELNRLSEQIRLADKAAGVTRTAAERRAAALVMMAQRSATVPENGRRPKPLFTVIVGDQRFRDVCELAKGIVVTPKQLMPYLTSSMLETILFDGPKTVLTVSAQRTFRGALRRAIEVRDRHCQHPSECDVPADHCQIDHIVPWSKGGTTSQFNGRAECTPHNVLTHLHDHDAEPFPERPVTPEHAVWAQALWRFTQPPDPVIDGITRWRVIHLPWLPPGPPGHPN